MEHASGTANSWIAVARRIGAIAQTGLAFATNAYDIERYRELSGIAAEMIAGSEPERIALAACFRAERGYATPKVDVRAAVLHDGRLLLVREREDGCWTLPGGWADVGQSAAESVEREVREESGYVVKAVKLLACWDRDKQGHPASLFHTYKLLFRCDLLGGSATTSAETTDVGFFTPDDLPELSQSRTLPGQIRFIFESLHNPDAPTVFD